MSYADPARVPENHRTGEDAPQEAVGPIAADSLAAESLNQGGDFAGGDAVASSQKGAGSTFNTTDTSGATALHPASSGAVRERQDEFGAGSDERGVAGIKYPEGDPPEFSGRHNLDGYTGGPSTDRQTGGYSSSQQAGGSDFGASTLGSSDMSEPSDQIRSSSNTDLEPGSISTGASSGGPAPGAGVKPYTDAAPSYAARVSGAIETEGQGKPKGDNLTEGDIPQTKTFTGDVGGQHDPGRLAERDFEKINADSATNTGARDRGDGGSNPYDVLGSERA